MVLLPSVEIMHLHFIFMPLHVCLLCTVCQVQPCLSSSAHKIEKSHLNWMKPQVTLRILMGHWVCSYPWVFFFFVNFDAVGRNFLPAITSHFPSETQRHAPNDKYYYLFCLQPFCEETILNLFAKEILPHSIILEFFFKSLTLTIGISQSIFIQKSGGM